MTSMLSRALAAVRVFLGFNDPSENHLHQAHGWLLPPVSMVRARPAVVSSAGPVKTDRAK
jgi:hypothetical protein